VLAVAAGPVPAALLADTVTVYRTPSVRPLSRQVRAPAAGTVQLLVPVPVGDTSTW
jgi:hypothetical protein